MFVHACHCYWCQRETGSAFAINALIEASRVALTEGEIETVLTPSKSGQGQRIVRCPTCRVPLWSYYGGKLKDLVAFVRVGTLLSPDLCPPTIHIYTESKQDWLSLSGDVPVVPAHYSAAKYWPQASLDRRAALFATLA
tara:strand:+ start:33890 stop:34306 length:417 start_codon:yes stop_codon:yes gene_type:complete